MESKGPPVAVMVPVPHYNRCPTPSRLGPGELVVIAYAYAGPGTVAGLDDMQARRVAEALGLTVAGTLGLLVRAKRTEWFPPYAHSWTRPL